jgi:hypothetical protein
MNGMGKHIVITEVQEEMYKVRVTRRKVFYFADWESACEFCLQAGISIKRVEVI